MVKGPLMTLRLEDRGSNELFAACPVEQFPGMSVEPVTDSSRYFVICIKVWTVFAFFKNGPSSASFSFIFSLFKQKMQILQQINVKSVHLVSSARIQTHNLLIMSLLRNH